MTNQLYILCGIPFSGKTTLAKEIIRLKGYVHIDLDTIKFELFGDKIKDSEINQSDWDKIYAVMYGRIKELLEHGKSVLHDTGNFTRYERGLISSIATDLMLPYTTIYVATSIEVAYIRLLTNRESKLRFDITDEQFQGAVAEMEIPGASENTLRYTPNPDIESWILATFK